MWQDLAYRWGALLSAVVLLVVCLWTVLSITRLAATWNLEMRSSASTPWSRAGHTIMLGSQVAAIATVASFLIWLPTMIMTWITAVVLSIPEALMHSWWGLRSKGTAAHSITEDGRRLARDISRHTLRTAATSGQMAALVVIGFGIASLLVWREVYDDD